MTKLKSTPSFERAYRKFARKHPQLQRKIDVALRLLEEDVYASSLNTHKLVGKLSGLEPIRKPALRPERERAGHGQGARSSRIVRYGDAAQRRPWPAQPREAQMRFSDRLLMACSCGYDCRIVFRNEEDEKKGEIAIILIDIGTHDEVY